MKVIKVIDPKKTKRNAYGARKTSANIHTILRQQGYTEEQIEEMKKNKQVLIIPSNYVTTLKGYQKLVIVEELTKPDPKDKLRNRFDNLDID